MSTLKLRIDNKRAVVRGEVREVVENGQKFVVAPIIAVQSQVLNGNRLTAAAIQKSAKSWIGIPITLDHPPSSMEPEDSIEWMTSPENFLGVIRNAEAIEGGRRLRVEGWFPVPAANAATAAVISAILDSETVLDVSTGYFAELRQSVGVLNGQKYEAEQVNIQPWHLAVLPDVEGACSVDDGCGVPRRNVAARVNADLRDQVDAIYRAVSQAFGPANEEMEWPRIVEVESDYVIFERGGKTYNVDYSIDSDGVIEFGEAVEGQMKFVANQAAADDATPAEPKTLFDRVLNALGIKGPQRPAKQQAETEDEMDRNQAIARIAEMLDVDVKKATEKFANVDCGGVVAFANSLKPGGKPANAAPTEPAQAALVTAIRNAVMTDVQPLVDFVKEYRDRIPADDQAMLSSLGLSADQIKALPPETRTTLIANARARHTGVGFMGAAPVVPIRNDDDLLDDIAQSPSVPRKVTPISKSA